MAPNTATQDIEVDSRADAHRAAGYAVAAIGRGLEFECVTVSPPGLINESGPDLGAMDIVVEFAVEQRAICALAGPAAHAQLANPAAVAALEEPHVAIDCLLDHRGGADFERALVMMAVMSGSDLETSARVYLAGVLAIRTVQRFWPHVERVADALMSTPKLTYDEVRKLTTPWE